MTLRKKLLITIACLSVILCVMVTGTIAWLTDNTEEITNTFTPSNIDITLIETDSGQDNDGNANTNSYQMIPGTDIQKIATVTVDNDVDCYVFLKVVENIGSFTYKDSGNNDVPASFDAYMTYRVAAGWHPLVDNNSDGIADDGVYFRTVAATADAADKTWNVLTDNKATVHGAVTKAMMDALEKAGSTEYPTLTFTAYAIQQHGFDTPADAWAELNKTP